MKRRKDPSIALGLSAATLSHARFLMEQDSGIATEGESDADPSFRREEPQGTYLFSDDDDTHPHPLLYKEIPSRSVDMLTSNSYCIHKADQTIQSIKQFMREDEWKKVLKHKSGVVVHMLQQQQKQKGTEKVAVFRGDSVIENFSPQAVFYVIGMRKLWDDHFDHGKLVENLNDTTSLTYESYGSSSSTVSKHRDVALVEKIECSNDGVIIFGCTSIETAAIPKVPGKVRDQIKLQAWVLKPLHTNPISTKVTYITQESVKGWIPGFTKKSLARRPLVIASINTYLQQKADRLRVSSTAADVHPSTTLFPTSTAVHTPLPSLPLKPKTSSHKRTSIYAQTPPPQQNSLVITQNHQTNGLNPLSPHKPSLPLKTIKKRTPSTKQVKFSDNVYFYNTIAQNRVSAQSMQSEATEATEASNSTSSTSFSISTAFGNSSLTLVSDRQRQHTTHHTLPPPLLPICHNPVEKLYPSSRHRATRKQCMDLLKELASEDLDYWKIVGEFNTPHLYSKPVQGSSLPIMRGESVIEGPWTPEQLCSVIQCFGARQIWDDLFETGHFVERFSQKEYLTFVQCRSLFPIQCRDFSLLTVIETSASTGKIYIASASVTDAMVPETKVSIRGRILLHGWVLEPLKQRNTPTGVKITFVCHMDLAGNTPLPPAIVRMLTHQVPACVDRMQAYLDKYSCPPYIRRVAGKIIHETFDVFSRMYHVGYIVKRTPSRQHKNNVALWCTDIRIHMDLYSTGFQIITRPSTGVRVELRSDYTGICIYSESDSLEGQIVEVILAANEEKDEIRYVCNGRLLKAISHRVDTPLIKIENEAPVETYDTSSPDSLHVPPWLSAPSNELLGPASMHLPSEQRARRNSYIVILGEDLFFTGPQLSIIVLLMAVCYYMGKLSSHC